MSIHMLSIDGGPQIGLSQSTTLMNLEDSAFNLANVEFCMVESSGALFATELEKEKIHLSTLYDYIIGT
jgi:hypothetical protein